MKSYYDWMNEAEALDRKLTETETALNNMCKKLVDIEHKDWITIKHEALKEARKVIKATRHSEHYYNSERNL